MEHLTQEIAALNIIIRKDDNATAAIEIFNKVREFYDTALHNLLWDIRVDAARQRAALSLHEDLFVDQKSTDILVTVRYLLTFKGRSARSVTQADRVGEQEKLSEAIKKYMEMMTFPSDAFPNITQEQYQELNLFKDYDIDG